MYLKGVSTRKVTAITKKPCGIDVSSIQVSAMTKLLDEEFSGFRERPLGEFPYVYAGVNGLERVNREIKRRTRVATLFPSCESPLRLMTGVLIEIHKGWVTGEAYLDMTKFKEPEICQSTTKRAERRPAA